MKAFLLALTVLLTIPLANATERGLPFSPEVDKRFDTLEDASVGGTLTDGKILLGNGSNIAAQVTPSGVATIDNTGVLSLTNTTADGTFAVKIAKATFSYADGDLDVTVVHGLGVSLPAKALIIRSWIHITTQLADTGTCSLAIQCEDANNIKTSGDLTGSAADALIEGESTGAASAFKKSIGSTCEISTLMTDTSSCVPSAGVGEVYVMYVVLP